MSDSQKRHLLDIESLSLAEINSLLDRADAAAPSSSLAGRTVVHLFVEASTRTRTSFEIAAKRLGASILNFNASSSSLSKGESLFDTVRTIEAMGPDVLVIRHDQVGAPHRVSQMSRSVVVNAGDGAHEHPTQALLDALTIRRRLGRLDGLKVTILGDVLHSRVARSNIHLLQKAGSTVTVCGPPTLIPRGIEALGVRVETRIDAAVEGADVVMALRMQQERMTRGYVPSLGEYARLYGLNAARLALAKPNALAMHPGPINRGVEISREVADGPQSTILSQVEHGVLVRMAVLEWVQKVFT